jgi:hypothetical protein
MKTVEEIAAEARRNMTFKRGWRRQLFYRRSPESDDDDAQAVFWILAGIAALLLVAWSMLA